MTDFEFLSDDEVPPAVTENREYVRYGEQAVAMKSRPGTFLRMFDVEVEHKDGEDADEANRLARRRADNRVGMVKQARGVFQGCVWETRISQPDGPGTAYRVYAKYIRDLTEQEITDRAAKLQAAREAREAKLAEQAAQNGTGEPQADVSGEQAPQDGDQALQPQDGEQEPQEAPRPRSRRQHQDA